MPEIVQPNFKDTSVKRGIFDFILAEALNKLSRFERACPFIVGYDDTAWESFRLQ